MKPHGIGLLWRHPLELLFVLLLQHAWLDLSSTFLTFLLAVRLERTSSLCRLNRRHQPQMGEPDSNGWSGTPGDSPQPKHTICVFLPNLIFYREDTWQEPRGSFSYRMGHNLNPSLRNWQGVFFRVSFPQQVFSLTCSTDATPIVALHLRPGVFEEFSLSFVPLLYHTLRGLSRGFINFFERSYLQWSVPRTLSS